MQATMGFLGRDAQPQALLQVPDDSKVRPPVSSLLLLACLHGCQSEDLIERVRTPRKGQLGLPDGSV